MNELEKVYRWRKKEGTGSHYFRYDGKKHRVKRGDIVDCPVRLVKPCIDQYHCIGMIGDGGELIKVDVDTILDESFDSEEDIKLKVIDLGDGLFDVVNPENPDKPINEKALSLYDANVLAGISVVDDYVNEAAGHIDATIIVNDDEEHVDEVDDHVSNLEVVPTGRGWYDVVDPTDPGKPINEKSLRIDEANKLAGISVKEEDE